MEQQFKTGWQVAGLNLPTCNLSNRLKHGFSKVREILMRISRKGE
jgi:hypothetical protein